MREAVFSRSKATDEQKVQGATSIYDVGESFSTGVIGHHLGFIEKPEATLKKMACIESTDEKSGDSRVWRKGFDPREELEKPNLGGEPERSPGACSGCTFAEEGCVILKEYRRKAFS